MSQPSFHLQYTLNRRQRLIPLLRIEGPLFVPFAVGLFLFFLVQAAVQASLTFAGFALGTFLLCRFLMVGLLDVLLIPVRTMDILIEKEAAGILIGGDRWYLFLDGITEIRKYREDTWTIRHFNRTILHISASAINEEQLAYIRSVAERGRTAKGIAAAIERGRRISEILDAERNKG